MLTLAETSAGGGASTSDIVLAFSTAVLALATVVLAGAAIWGGKVALRDLGESREVAKQSKEALEQTKRIAEQSQKTLEQAKDIADADTRRRRAEISQAALRRWMAVHDSSHPVVLAAARAVTARREAEASGSTIAKRCTIEEYLAMDDASEDCINALQKCLDALEEISVGVRLGVYDEYVIYHGAASVISQWYRDGKAHIERVHAGKVPHRPAQISAYEHTSWLIEECFAAIKKAGEPARLAGALDV